MSFGEKSAWITAVVTGLIYAAYVTTILGRAPAGSLVSDTPYIWPMIYACVGTIVGIVVAIIAISIAAPGDAGAGDERDARILQKGEYLGLYLVAVGSIAGMILAMLEAPYFWIANALYLGLVLSTLTSAAIQIIAYRRGLPQW